MKSVVTALLFVAAVAASHAQPDFHRYFVDRTMRIDYFHSGTKDTDQYALDRVYSEGTWPGSLVNLIDTLNRGESLVRLYDFRTGVLLYSRGFSTVFGEWQTTDEALKGLRKTISETVRFPYPKQPVQLTVSKRDKYSVFHELFSIVIDPNDPTQVVTENRSSGAEVLPLMDNGDPHKKVDIVIVGDGYATGDLAKFKADAKHFNDVMFGTSPFKERKADFNVRAICLPSAESGIDIPDKNVWKSTPLGTMYNTFGSARYVLTEANREMRDALSQVPYDFVCILINDSRYGGGGIYQLYTTTYTIEKNKGQEWQRDYVYVHEFGHSFGGLGDEYYSSSTGYNEFYPEGVEPWEPNVTRLLQVPAVKWSAMVSKDVALPTDWGKSAYDSIGTQLSRLDRLAEDYYSKRDPLKKKQEAILTNAALRGKVCAFEGAGYVSTGMYRPSLDCRMFSLSLVDFDPVCRAAIEQQIDFYAK